MKRCVFGLLFLLFLTGCTAQANTKEANYVITQEAYNAIIKAAMASPNAEVGGLLGGEGNTIYAVELVENIAENKRKSHEFTAEGAKQPAKKINDKGYVVLGSWHSHVIGPSLPSFRDATDSNEFWYDKPFLIFSLDENKATMWRTPSKEEQDGQPEKLTVHPLKFTVIADVPEPVTVTKDQ